MTAQNSAAKSGVFYKFLPYYRNKVRYLRPQLIMCSILSLLSYPLLTAMVAAACGASNDYYQKYNELIQNHSGAQAFEQMNSIENNLQTMYSLTITAAVIAGLCLVALFIFTFATTLRGFRYLYNRTTVDMDYSLPVNHNTRFFGDLAAVFTVSILPHLAAALIGTLILAFVQAPEEGTAFPAILEMIRQAAFTGVAACVMQIAVCLLTLSVCGRTAEAYIYPVLVNVAIPVIHVLGILLVESGVYGAVLGPYSGGFASSMYSISSTSPIGMVIATVYSWFSTSAYDAGISSRVIGTAPIMQVQYLVPAVIVTLALLAGAYFLMKFRRAERVGMSFVYRGTDVIVPGIVIFSIVMPVCYSIAAYLRNQDYFGTNGSSDFILGLIIGTIIGTFIFYIIMSLISGKNFRRFGLTVLSWAGTLAASVVICALLNLCNGFGSGSYIPAPSEVKSVQATYLDHRETETDYSSPDRYFNITARSGDELLELVRDIHEEALGDMFAEKNSLCTVSLYYVLKDGGTLLREYDVTSATLEKVKAQMLSPEGWSSNVLSSLNESLLDGYKIESVSADGMYTDLTSNAGAAGELTAAIRADSARVSPEFFKEQYSWKDNVIRIDLTKNDAHETQDRVTIVVYDWMENTIALLDRWGMDIAGGFTPAGYSAAFIERAQGNGVDVEYMLRMADNISEEEYSEVTGDTMDDLQSRDSFGRVDTGDPTLEELVAASGSGDTYTEGDYLIVLTQAGSWQEYMDGHSECMVLRVPDDMADIAESLMMDNIIQEYIPTRYATYES